MYLFLETNCTSRQVPSMVVTNLPTVVVVDVCHYPLTNLTSNTEFLTVGPTGLELGFSTSR